MELLKYVFGGALLSFGLFIVFANYASNRSRLLQKARAEIHR